ncbi:MAG: hypothetical protein RJB34_1786 [Pseudomonadota bacterium]
MRNKIIDEILITNEWRDGEFSKLKTKPENIDENLWWRMCIPMIYAHWEGYVVSSLKLLIEYLNSKELAPSNVPTKFIVIGLGNTYRSLSGKQSFEQRVMFTEKFNALLKEKIKFTKEAINTKANLKSDVLEELCSMWDFDYSKFKDLTSDINQLVHIRNSIAHGENNFIPDSNKISQYIGCIKNAIDIFSMEIEAFIDNEKYSTITRRIQAPSATGLMIVDQ